uniref:RING-type domain-containing protein n=1 Tax=Toxocara canis TaxID=6265 RepID=A0A183VCZ3_TOXCA
LRAGLCKLGCLHGICTDCLRESITGQIRQGISPVKCHDENCDCAIPIGLIRVLLPVPLYIFYVKFSYMQMKKRNNEEVRSCPLCLQAGVVTSKSYRSLCCSACATCFCEECEKMPHWPLTCNEFDDWSEKFEPQYEMEKCRLDGKLKEYLVTRRCHFGELIEAPDNIGVQKCSTCLLTYDWATGRSIVDCRCYVGKDEQGMPVWKRPEAEFVSQRKPLTMVNRQFAPICASARRKRFEEVKVTNMIAKCTHQSQPSGQILNARRVVDLRNTSLYLVEYGTAWLFEHRMSPPDNWKQIRNQVTKLEQKLDIVVARLSSKTDSELSVQQCSQAISSLEALVAAIISLLQLSA